MQPLVCIWHQHIYRSRKWLEVFNEIRKNVEWGNTDPEFDGNPEYFYMLLSFAENLEGVEGLLLCLAPQTREQTSKVSHAHRTAAE